MEIVESYKYDFKTGVHVEEERIQEWIADALKNVQKKECTFSQHLSGNSLVQARRYKTEEGKEEVSLIVIRNGYEKTNYEVR